MSFQRMLMMATRETRPYLPHPEALFALYVPRWQAATDRQVLRDYASTHNMSLVGNVSWRDDCIFFDGGTKGNYATSESFSFTVDTYTILANRDVNYYHGNNQCGCKITYNLSNHYACELVERYRGRERFICECGGRENSMQVNDMPLQWTYQTNETYNGIALTRGIRKAWQKININLSTPDRSDYPMWTRVSALAIWTRVLTSDEIEQAKEYLTHVNNSNDFDE